MSRYLRCSMLFLYLIACIYLPAAGAQDIVISEIGALDLKGNDIIEVESNSARGFNFPYFLFIPDTIDKNQQVYILIETNNTNCPSDDFDFHRQKALKLIKISYPNLIAGKLKVPLLIPVFPRSRTDLQIKTQSLNRDTLEIADGPLKRLDLQLLAMIDNAAELLRTNGYRVHDKVFMHGFSDSGQFCNRFTFLHPERVKAAAAGGVNGLPTLPVMELNGHTLPFPIGIADIHKLTGQYFNEEALRRVPQYIYMGSLDKSDDPPSRGNWSVEEADLVSSAIARTTVPDRWNISQNIYRQKLPLARCVTYNDVKDCIKQEMLDDVVDFFEANSGYSFAAIEPHTNPVNEYMEIHETHVYGVYRKHPEYVGMPLREGEYLLCTDEWIEGRDADQLSEFVENAGFDFRLCAEGYPDIILKRRNCTGFMSSGRGHFQAYYLKLNEEQKMIMVPGVAYTLHPENKNEKYVWVINDDVRLIEPAPYELEVPEKLDSIRPPEIRIDADVADAVEYLNRLVVGAEFDGKPIHFKLMVGSWEVSQMPRISFSAQGLSAMELLLIICHRGSLDYRIEESIIYIENEKK